MREVSIQHWLRPSVLEGAWLLLNEALASRERSLEDHVRLLSSTYSSSGFDYRVACEIVRQYRDSHATGKAAFLRLVFMDVMRLSRPPMLVLLTRGRQAFLAALPADVGQCFVLCEAMTPSPSDEVLRWLDALSSIAREDAATLKTAMGREAERYTFLHESIRLKKLGYERMPYWVALDDNAAGYDVGSWAGPPLGACNRIIEVKACTGHRPEFHLSRNEIAVATRRSEEYVVHVWQLRERLLLELPWRVVAPYLPSNTARSRLEDIVITWPDWSASYRPAENYDVEVNHS